MIEYNKDPITMEELFEDVEDPNNPWRLHLYEDLIKKAKQGDIASIYEIGETYNQSSWYWTAVQWYKIAADKNYAPAIHSMGFMYSNGYGVTLDYQLGVEWYLKAAKQKYKYAIYRMGVMFENGWGVPVDQHRANEWYYKNSIAPIPEEESNNLENTNTTDTPNNEESLDIVDDSNNQEDTEQDTNSSLTEHPYEEEEEEEEEEDYHLTDKEKEKTVDELIREAELILALERLKNAKDKITDEMEALKETNKKMQKELNLADGRIQLLRVDNQILKTDLENQKKETGVRIEALEKSVEQLVEFLHDQKADPTNKTS